MVQDAKIEVLKDLAGKGVDVDNLDIDEEITMI